MNEATQSVYITRGLHQVIHTHREVWFASHATPQIMAHHAVLVQSQTTENELN